MIQEEVAKVQSEALAPIDHTLRFLASGFNDLSFQRRDAAVSGINDQVRQQQIKNGHILQG